MTVTRLADHLVGGTHAARPAANAVPVGTLYSCSDHSLIYQSDGSSWSTYADLTAAGAVALDDLTDVATAGAATDDVLTYNGSSWAPAAIPTPPAALDDLSDVTITSAVAGNALVYSGSAWVNRRAAVGMDDLGNFDDRWGSPLGSYDYEFDAADTTTLPSGWAWVNQGSSAYREVGGFATLTAGYSGGSTSATETHRMITRSRPSESAWDLMVKIPSLNCEQVANVRAGIVARNSSSGNYLLIGRAITDSNISRVRVDTWSALNTANTTEIDAVMVTVPTHFRLTQINSSVWVLGVSNDGSAFVNLGIYDPSSDGYDEVGICVGFPDTGTYDDASAAIEWFRVRS